MKALGQHKASNQEQREEFHTKPKKIQAIFKLARSIVEMTIPHVGSIIGSLPRRPRDKDNEAGTDDRWHPSDRIRSDQTVRAGADAVSINAISAGIR